MTNINQDPHFLCPVCTETMMFPRLYPCGHNICEKCMIKNDETQKNNVVRGELPIFTCPICRHETIKEWWSRPINTTLIDVLSILSPEYKTKHANYEKIAHDSYTEVTIPNNINLAYICKNMREYKANEFYKQILPILYKAAVDGKPFITISSEHTNFSSVADILADKLIKQNGIYRFIANNRECQIELVPSENHYRYNYDNPNYNTNNPNTTNDTFDNDTFDNDTSGNDTSGNDTSGNDTSGNDTSGNDNSGNDNSGNDNSGNDNSGSQLRESDAGFSNINNIHDTISILQPFFNSENSPVNATNITPEQMNDTNLEIVETSSQQISNTISETNTNDSIINGEIRSANGIISVSVENNGSNFNQAASRDISRLVVNNILRNLQQHNLASTNN